MQPTQKFPVAAAEWVEENEARWSESNFTIQRGSLKHLSPEFNRKLLNEITAGEIGRYQKKRKREGASNRTVNIEVSTLRMILKRYKLWKHIEDNIRMLRERENVGKALEREEATRLLKACFASNQPSLFPAAVIYCNSGMLGAELRCARWWQVNFEKCEFQVGKAKTASSDGRIIPLNQSAMDAFTAWRARWPDARPVDLIFPSENSRSRERDRRRSE